MKIVIPVDDKSMESCVGNSLGRSNYLLFYNTDTKETSYLDNRAVAGEGGAGVRVAQVVADKGTKAIITMQCGENAEKVLRRAEVLIYKSIPGTVNENIEALIGEKMNLLNEFQKK